MNVENVYILHNILQGRRVPISKKELLEITGWSESKLKRTKEYMLNFLGAEIEYDRDANGYIYSNLNYELPGLWFSSDELLSIVSMANLLAGLNLGILQTHLTPLKSRIDKLLITHKIKVNNFHRIKILPINARINNPILFQKIAVAVLLRNAITITYHARGNNQISNRTVSPQRLLHYRDNWYLDAWCHSKNQLRTFAIDKIKAFQNSNDLCVDINDDELDAHFKSGYGIFAGKAENKAILIFSKERSRWVADEEWHPDQSAIWLADGRYQLEVPYADERELIMDVMRYLPDVEITAPASLKQQLVSYLKEALKKHK